MKNIELTSPSSGVVTNSTSMKRTREVSNLDLDTENFDPLASTPMNKKNRSGLAESLSSMKASHFNFNLVTTPTVRPIRPLCRSKLANGNPVKFSTMPTTDDILSGKARKHSALSAVNKSPKSKAKGILATRRKAASIVRIDPPQHHRALPFSIDAAITAPVNTYPTVRGSAARAAPFVIHQDTEFEELGNIMEHRTCTLDISDDEEHIAAKNDRGKENIPPPGYVSPAPPASRRDMMTDEPRSPLTNLNAVDYYGEGCDVNDIILVAADNEAEITVKDNNTTASHVNISGPSSVKKSVPEPEWSDLLGQIAAKQARFDLEAELDAIPEIANNDKSTAIEIWESESAAGENETSDEVPVSALS